MEHSTIVRGKYVLTGFPNDPLLVDAAVAVEGNRIADVGDIARIRSLYPGARELGGDNALVMPGLIDAHTHGRGMSFIQRGGGFDFLENSLMDWPAVFDLPPDLNAPLCALRHLINGCTTLHHNEMGKPCDEHACERSLTVLNGYAAAGIRAAYSPGIRDENMLAYGDEAFLDTLPAALRRFGEPLVHFDKKRARALYFQWFNRLYDERNSDMSRIFHGPNWAHGASDEYLLAVKESANAHGGLPIHIHTLQTPHQRAFGLQKYGKSLLRRLDGLGLVDERLTLGHAVHLDDSDIALLAQKHASITHHPSCNLAMRNGIAPVYALVRAGVNVAIGVDEKGINDDDDVFMELRMAYYLSRISGYDLENTPALTPRDVLRMGMGNAARSLGMENITGRLAAGLCADIITLDLRRIFDFPGVCDDADLLTLLIHRAKGGHVRMVMVDGKPILQDGKVLSLDVPALFQEVRERISHGTGEAQQAYGKSMAALKPYMQKWYRGLLGD